MEEEEGDFGIVFERCSIATSVFDARISIKKGLDFRETKREISIVTEDQNI